MKPGVEGHATARVGNVSRQGWPAGQPAGVRGSEFAPAAVATVGTRADGQRWKRAWRERSHGALVVTGAADKVGTAKIGAAEVSGGRDRGNQSRPRAQRSWMEQAKGAWAKDGSAQQPRRGEPRSRVSQVRGGRG